MMGGGLQYGKKVCRGILGSGEMEFNRTKSCYKDLPSIVPVNMNTDPILTQLSKVKLDVLYYRSVNKMSVPILSPVAY